MTHPLLRLELAVLLTFPAAAQDNYWIANRASLDIMQVTPWGQVLQRVATPTTLRSAHVAPDGKVWIVRFGTASFDIYDPVTATFATGTSMAGSPFQIAFDAQGNAWISGGTGVQQFSPAGVFVQTYPLLAIDPATFLFAFTGVGTFNLPVAIPSLNSLLGFELLAQGVTVAIPPALRNVTGIKVW